MFSTIFAVNTSKTLNYDVESENESDIESIGSENHLNILGKSLYYENNVEYCLADARQFIINIIPWSCQRELNENHVNTLIESIKSRNSIIGTFKVIRNGNNELRCIDGQHRTEALKKIMENDAKFNCNILVEVYDVEDFESDDANELFKDANCVLNVVNCNPNTITQNVLKKLDLIYPGMIIDVKEGGRCNRPRINRKNFVLQMNKIVMNYDEDNIIKNIEILNNKIGMWNDRVKSTKIGKFPRTMLDKVKYNGFYIGLYNDFKWIDELEIELLSE